MTRNGATPAGHGLHSDGGENVVIGDCCASPPHATAEVRDAYRAAHACCHAPGRHLGADPAHDAPVAWVTWECRCGGIEVPAGRSVAITCNECGYAFSPAPITAIAPGRQQLS